MQYILDSTFQLINESEGTLVNNSNFKVEVSTSNVGHTGVILFPRQHLQFRTTIYAARAPGEEGHPVVAVHPFVCCDGCTSPPPPSDPVDDDCCECDCECCEYRDSCEYFQENYIEVCDCENCECRDTCEIYNCKES